MAALRSPSARMTRAPADLRARLHAAFGSRIHKGVKYLIMAVAGSAAIGAASALYLLSSAAAKAGARRPHIRETIALDSGNVAVAEAGAELSWRIDRAATTVRQSQGNVFYRVERGRPFVVQTPAVRIEVKGTCFQIEVEPMRSTIRAKELLAGAGAGALLTAAVLVKVYEGRVQVKNENGQVELRPG